MDLLIFAMVFLPIAAAFLSFLLGRKTKAGRDFFVWSVVGAEFVLSLVLFFRGAALENVLVTVPGVCGLGLHFTVDGFRSIYAVIAALMWLVTGLFSPEYFAHYRNRNRYYLFVLVTLGATEAVFLSADLYTTFVFFEIMSLCSYVWVAQDEKPGSLRAGGTYLAVAVIGGMVLLMGIFLLYHQTGTLMIAEISASAVGIPFLFYFRFILLINYRRAPPDAKKPHGRAVGRKFVRLAVRLAIQGAVRSMIRLNT